MYKLVYCNDEHVDDIQRDHIIDVCYLNKKDNYKIIMKLLNLGCMYCHCFKAGNNGKEKYVSTFGAPITNLF